MPIIFEQRKLWVYDNVLWVQKFGQGFTVQRWNGIAKRGRSFNRCTSSSVQGTKSTKGMCDVQYEMLSTIACDGSSFKCIDARNFAHVLQIQPCDVQLIWHIGDQKIHFYFFKRPEHYNQEVLSHSFSCLPLPYMEAIVLISSIDLYCAIVIFNGHRQHVQ